MANSRKRMNVVSLSFDGCVYHHHYDFQFDPNAPVIDNQNPFAGVPNTDFDRLTDENKRLIDHVASRVDDGGFQEVVMLVGCLRQDNATESEKRKAFNRGSCVQDLPVLRDAIQQKVTVLNPAKVDIKFRVDTYLLADTYGILSNFDLADAGTQDAARCYEAEALMAANAADDALTSVAELADKIKEAEDTIRSLKEEIKVSKSYLKKIEKEEQVRNLEEGNIEFQSQGVALRAHSKVMRERSTKMREELKVLRRKPFGYGLLASMDPAVAALRKEIATLRRKANALNSDIDRAMRSRNPNLGALQRYNQQRAICLAKAEELTYATDVYTKAMHVGSTWNSILLGHQVDQLRQSAEVAMSSATYYRSEGSKFQSVADDALRKADLYEASAQQAIAKGEVSAANNMYAKATQWQDAAKEPSAQADELYGFAAGIAAKAQRNFDDANLLALGPYAYSLLSSSISAREAIIKSGGNPDTYQPNAFNHPTCFADESKLTLLYAQMHKAAAENPEKEIVFDFYDARHDVLSGLANFLGAHHDLMPDNLTLCLHQYVGNDVVKIAEVKGRGPADYNYHNNVRYMVEHAGFRFINGYRGNAPTKPTADCSDIGVMAGFAVSANLRAFKKQREFFIDTLDHWQRPYHLGTFDPKIYLGQLYADIESFPEDAHHLPLKNALARLYEELQADIIEQVRKGLPPTKIAKSAAKEMIEMTRNFLNEFKAAKTEERSVITADFVNRYEKTTRLRTFGKVVAVIFAALLGMIVGAAIGIGVGFAAGLITGPGAVVSGLCGMLAGATAGTIAGIAAGSVIAGVGCGVAAKFALFGIRPDGKTLAMRSVMEAGHAYVKSSVVTARVEEGSQPSGSRPAQVSVVPC